MTFWLCSLWVMCQGNGHIGKKQAVLPGKEDLMSHSVRETGYIGKKQAVLPGKVDLMSHSVRKTGHIEKKQAVLPGKGDMMSHSVRKTGHIEKKQAVLPGKMGAHRLRCACNISRVNCKWVFRGGPLSGWGGRKLQLLTWENV